MAKVSRDRVDELVSSNSVYLNLGDDGDIEKVRFLYENREEMLEYQVVHQVEIDKKSRYVDCLRNPDDPIDVCPFCESGLKPLAKLFLQVARVDKDGRVADSASIFERGKNYEKDLESHFRRVSEPLWDQVVEIERSGAKGDKQTKYLLYNVDGGPVDSQELPVNVDLVESGFLLSKNADEMDYYLEYGCFADDEGGSSRPVRRGSAPQQQPAATSRRAPATAGTARAGAPSRDIRSRQSSRDTGSENF